MIDVLVVSSIETNKQALIQGLRQYAMLNIISATGISDADAILKGQSIDCIFVDYQIDGGTGIEFIEYIREQDVFVEHGIPAILLHFQYDIQLAIKALNSGAQDFLVKSQCSFDQYYVAIQKVLHHTNIARQWAMTKEQLMGYSMDDPVSGLSNHIQLEHDVNLLIKHTLRTKKPFAIVILEIDDLDSVIDSCGDFFSNKILSLFASRLQMSSREDDLFYRRADNQFVAILSACDRGSSAGNYVNRLKKIIEAEMCIEGKQMSVSVDYGVAVYPVNGDTLEHLINSAEQDLLNMKLTSFNKPNEK